MQLSFSGVKILCFLVCFKYIFAKLHRLKGLNNKNNGNTGDTHQRCI